jgi:hypothetical protein
MKKHKLSESGARGWFIGDFPEAVVRTRDFEVNYQLNPKGHTPSHLHKIITEVTLVISGRMLVNGQLFEHGDIFILEPGDIGQVEYLDDCATVAIKFPSIPDDKYYV